MSSLAQTILVTGTSRGIGLELVRKLAETRPKVLIACCRNPPQATDLKDIAKENECVTILKMDVESDGDIDAAVRETESLVGDTGLNLLINNAGIFLDQTDGGSVRVQNRERMQRHFNVNSTSPILVTQKFLPLLELAASTSTSTSSNTKTDSSSSSLSCSRAASIIISSQMGSKCLAQNGETSQVVSLEYKCSKAAVCMAAVLMSRDLRDSGILVFSIHPGWVRTDMGGQDAKIGKEESVEGILRLLAAAEEKESGWMLDYNGVVLPF